MNNEELAVEQLLLGFIRALVSEHSDGVDANPRGEPASEPPMERATGS